MSAPTTSCVLLPEKERIAEPLRKGSKARLVWFPEMQKHMETPGQEWFLTAWVRLAMLPPSTSSSWGELEATTKGHSCCCRRRLSVNLTHFLGCPISLWSADQTNDQFSLLCRYVWLKWYAVSPVDANWLKKLYILARWTIQNKRLYIYILSVITKWIHCLVKVLHTHGTLTKKDRRWKSHRFFLCSYHN